VVAAGTTLSLIQWVFWSALNRRAVASRSPLRLDYRRSGHIDVNWFRFLEEKYLLVPIASLLRYLKEVAPGLADSRLWLEEVLLLFGWCGRPSKSNPWLAHMYQKETPRLLQDEAIALGSTPNASRGGEGGEVPC